MALRTILSIILLLAFLASEAAGQSITSGAIAGTVNDSAGQPLGNAHVVLTARSSGFTRSAESSRDGTFDFEYLPSGQYEVFVEQLGYRPARITGIPARPGGESHVVLTLHPAVPPVDSVAVIPYGAAVAGGDPAAWQIGRFALRDLPDQNRDLGSLARLVTSASGGFGFEGLPSQLTTFAVDGVPYTGAGDPALPERKMGTAPFALSAFNDVSVLPGGLDVEWGDAPGAIVSAQSVRGGNSYQVSAFGDWFGKAGASSKYFAPENLAHTTGRAGLIVTGPIIRDTAQFAFGIEARHLETPAPPLWAPGPLDSAIVAIASDSFGVDLSADTAARLEQTDAVSGFGRFDWQLGQSNHVTARANVASFKTTDPGFGLTTIPGIGMTLRGHDVSTGATLTSRLSDNVALEVRVGVDAGLRDYTGGSVVATTFADQPIRLGVDPALPGRFSEIGFTSTETLHAHLGNHRIKFGAIARRSSFDYTYRYDSQGQAYYSGASGFAAQTGVFEQTVGTIPIAKFSPLEFGGFFQDRWRAAPGLDVIAGIRVASEILSRSDVTLNTQWLAATGISNDSTLPSSILKLDPRFGIDWDVGDRHQWRVSVESGLYDGSMGPSVLDEMIVNDGSPQVRLAAGQLGGWPASPDSTVAPPSGGVLTLLGPKFRPPRTGRVSFNIRGALGGGTALQLGVTYRHTDFLPRRQDLNLIESPTGTDQYGRPVYGQLTQIGSLVAAQPGSNRRFSGFGPVSAINADGYSDYVGFTARLDRPIGRVLHLMASYTHSQTKDNWLSALGGGLGTQLSPFPDSLAGADWADGTSSLDVPDRVAVGASLDFRVFRISGVYTYRSGYPFTPGFAPGVDANGDGSYTNDPAYIDNNITGVSDLFGTWDCLRTQVGHFAARNSCRGPAVSGLDLRLVLGPMHLGYPVAIVVDALNLVEPNNALPDAALFLVDPNGTVTTDPATGNVNIPLVVNPNFGKPTYRLTPGRILRVGLRVNYE